MNPVPDTHWIKWNSGQFVGENRPMGRVLVTSIDVVEVEGGYRAHLFGNAYDTNLELTGVKTISIDRRIGGDAGACTIVAINEDSVIPENLGLDVPLAGTSVTKRSLEQYGDPGHKTFNRGTATEHRTRWGQEVNEWVDILLPNRVLMTFQGYGTDGAAFPQDDQALTLSGVWLIDTVKTGADGVIEITARDAAKLLIEQKLFPPVLPVDRYPFNVYGPTWVRPPIEEIITGLSETGPPEPVTSPNYAVHVAPTDNYPVDSSVALVHKGNNLPVHGHYASQAFDANETTHWLSNGYANPDPLWVFPWIEARCNNNLINQVRFKPWRGLSGWDGGATRYYISISETNRGWLGGTPAAGETMIPGSGVIPYQDPPWTPETQNLFIGGGIPYVMTAVIGDNTPFTPGEGWEFIDMPWFPELKSVHTVRITFRSIPFTGYEFTGGFYHAGMYEFVANSVTFPAVEQTGGDTIIIDGYVGPEDPIKIDDYTDLVKLFCAWAGFYWLLGSGG